MIPRGSFPKALIFLVTIAFFLGSVDSIYGERSAQPKTIPGAASDQTDENLPRQLAHIVPPGWELMGAVRRFAPENLWKQIDGRAEFFLSYDMVQMTFAVYSHKSNPETFIDVAVYDMGNPTRAFGVFSAERQKDVYPVDLGREGYGSGANLFIWKGPYYVRMIASGDNPPLQKINLKLAEKLSGLLDDSGESVWGLETLPKADRVLGSEQYFRKDAMGLDFMQNTYTARYRKNGVLITVFLLHADGPAAAGEILNRYAAYARQFGEGLREVKQGDVAVTLCDMGGSYDALFQKDDMVAGVTSVEDRKLAVDSAVEIWRYLNGK